MVDKIKKKKLRKVTSTESADKIDDAGVVASVHSVQGPTVVKGLSRADQRKRRRKTREITLAERQELFRIIDEEAETLLKSGDLSQSSKEIVADAVKMAIDSSLIDEDEDKDNSEKENLLKPGKKK